MGFENTITENDLDSATQQSIQGLRRNGADIEPDLDVDGLSDSIVARLKRFLAFGRG